MSTPAIIVFRNSTIVRVVKRIAPDLAAAWAGKLMFTVDLPELADRIVTPPLRVVHDREQREPPFGAPSIGGQLGSLLLAAALTAAPLDRVHAQSATQANEVGPAAQGAAHMPHAGGRYQPAPTPEDAGFTPVSPARARLEQARQRKEELKARVHTYSTSP